MRFGIAPRPLLIPPACLLLGLLAGGAAAQTPVDIIALHNNTASGAPAAPYAIGTAVTVRGVLTVGVGTFTTEYTDIYIQDATAGIMIYQSGTPPHAFQIGDSLTVSGTIAQYRGMTEVALGSYTVHASGLATPEPLVVTCDQVEHAFGGPPSYSEPNEGRLVRINGVTWTGTWPSFSGGVQLQDASGTCTMFIDGTTGIQSMTPPGGEFDVIGVIKQYDENGSPYTDGYEILPRMVADIILGDGPQVLSGPRETDIQANQVTILLETDTETTVTIQYGPTTAYELGSATDGLSGTTHAVVLPGLEAATVYHYRVTAIDGNGQTTSPDRIFSSGSAAGCTGVIRAVFNKSVDHSLAIDEEAIGGQNLLGWLLDRINATQETIDVAIYSFNIPAVTDALIAAKDRGVQVRFIYEYDNYNSEIARLQSNGIWIVNDGFGDNTGSGLMHHKLWIFDAHRADPAAPWVYTGSWNISTQGTYTDAQNLIMIQDQALARVCWLEFNEMWGSGTWLPNASLSRFGANKTDNTPKVFRIGGREVEFFFAPSDPWLAEVIHEVDDAQAGIHFSVFSYTRYDLCNAMEARWMGVPGFEVRGVFDHSEIGNPSSQYVSMIGQGDYAWSPPADVWLDLETGDLHHKYMIVDTHAPSGDPLVVTGSANWSNSACNENDENVVIVHDAVLANVYLQEFAERYHAAGGTGPLAQGAPEPELAEVGLRLETNPTIGGVRVAFTLPEAGRVRCDLIGVDGRRAAALIDATLPAGAHALAWNAEAGVTALPAGIYFLRLDTKRESVVRRVTLMR